MSVSEKFIVTGWLTIKSRPDLEIHIEVPVMGFGPSEAERNAKTLIGVLIPSLESFTTGSISYDLEEEYEELEEEGEDEAPAENFLSGKKKET